MDLDIVLRYNYKHSQNTLVFAIVFVFVRLRQFIYLSQLVSRGILHFSATKATIVTTWHEKFAFVFESVFDRNEKGKEMLTCHWEWVCKTWCCVLLLWWCAFVYVADISATSHNSTYYETKQKAKLVQFIHIHMLRKNCLKTSISKQKIKRIKLTHSHLMHFVWFSLSSIHPPSHPSCSSAVCHFAASIFRRKTLRSSNFGGKHSFIFEATQKFQCRAKSPFIFPLYHLGRFFPL